MLETCVLSGTLTVQDLQCAELCGTDTMGGAMSVSTWLTFNLSLSGVFALSHRWS